MEHSEICKVVNNYMADFKSKIIEESTLTTNEKQFIEEYPEIVINERKKRLRNIIPDEDRCHAYKASLERCTRKKKNGENVCGTHMKGVPHGVINETTPNLNQHKKINIWTQDICGIVYYIDDGQNVYNSSDIMKNIPNPRVIGHYSKDTDGEYCISHF
jgi:hypothetical protein